MPKKGIIAVISGFSGAGKGTVVNELVKKYGYAISVSATTRQPREGEEEGKNYFFKTKEEFEQMIKDGKFIELERRLFKRGTETEEVIKKRIARAAEECSYMKEYDYIIVNDGLEECVEQMHCLLQSLHFTKNNQQQLIGDISRDFASYSN